MRFVKSSQTKQLFLITIFVAYLTACFQTNDKDVQLSQEEIITVTPFEEMLPTTPNANNVPPMIDSRIIPGKTTRAEVETILGEPDSVSLNNDWYYRLLNQQSSSTVIFQDDIVKTFRISTLELSLGEVIEALGSPEGLELRIVDESTHPPEDSIKRVHYPSLGVSYLLLCDLPIDTIETECQRHRYQDEVYEVVQYPPVSLDKLDRLFFIEASGGKLVAWPGLEN